MPQPIFGPGRSEQAESLLRRERDLRARARGGRPSARGQSELNRIGRQIQENFGTRRLAQQLAANARERVRIGNRRNLSDRQRRALRVETDRREARLMRESGRAVKKAAKKAAAKKARPAKKAAKKVAKKARPAKKAAKKARPVKKAAKKTTRRPR